jgi:hypothetical protein
VEMHDFYAGHEFGIHCATFESPEPGYRSLGALSPLPQFGIDRPSPMTRDGKWPKTRPATLPDKTEL